MLILSAEICSICGKHPQNLEFKKDEDNNSIYLADPKFHPSLKEPLHFCSPECSTKWYLENSYNVKV